MDLNKLCEEVHANAVAKGFWDKPLSDSHFLMLVITELSEAVEADRIGKRFDKEKYEYNEVTECQGWLTPEEKFINVFNRCIKDTVEDELADAFIRLLDLFGAREVYLNEDAFDRLTIVEYSVTHKRKSFTESIFHITRFICASSGSIERSAVTPEMTLLEILGFAEHLGINLMWHVEQKMKYNQLRERMHGKKY